MATVPLVNAPIPTQPGTGNVRADSGMTSALGSASASVGQGVARIGEVMGEQALRVKNATDMAYTMTAQAKLEGAQRDFQTWTQTNPDTSTWGEEWDSRKKAVLDDVNQGSKNLGGAYRTHLDATTKAWGTLSTSSFNHLKSQQDVRNAIGQADEAINLAIVNNDESAAHDAIQNGLHSGLWNGAHAAQLEKRVRVGIATNVANQDIMDDPFGAPERLDAKDAAGNYVNYPGLTPAARTTMHFRASKLASETRSKTMQTWQQAVDSARQNGTPLPDEDAMRQEAARQGISPKWMDKLFQPQREFDVGSYAKLRSQILGSYDPTKDTDNMERAKITEAIYSGHFPAQTQSELLNDLNKKSDPSSPYNSHLFKEAAKLNQQNFEKGLYGKFQTRVRDEKGGEWKTVTNPKALLAAQETMAKVTDALADFITRHPQASNQDVAKEMARVYRGASNKTGASLFRFNP